MKNKTWKTFAIGLFVVAMLMNVSVYFDSSGSSTSDLTLGNMKVNLFQKAYASCVYVGDPCVYVPTLVCWQRVDDVLVAIGDHFV